MKELLKKLGLSENQVKQILLENHRMSPRVLDRYLTKKNVIKFGIVSDTHLCSRQEKLNELHTFYAICKKIGVEDVLHIGDLVDGNGRIYRGQLNEIHTYGVIRQANYVIKNYPQEKGIKTFFITGNHCLSFYNENGVDIGNLIVEKRDDMIYLGQYQADIKLGRAKVRLLHHDKNPAYALSYPGQKLAEQIASGQKPDILLLGHLHSSFYFWYRNIHIFNCGTFQGQTAFLLRKGINPAIGGWICEIKEGKKDNVVALTISWIPFF